MPVSLRQTASDPFFRTDGLSSQYSFHSGEEKRSTPLDAIALPHPNITLGFAQLAVVRISWWVLLLRKLAGVMGHGSLQLAIAPRAFPGGGLVFSACLAEACGCVMVDSVLGKGAVILGNVTAAPFRVGHQRGSDCEMQACLMRNLPLADYSTQRSSSVSDFHVLSQEAPFLLGESITPVILPVCPRSGSFLPTQRLVITTGNSTGVQLPSAL